MNFKTENMRYLALFIFISIFSCSEEKEERLKTGSYRAVLEVQNGEELAFNFHVSDENTLKIFNAEEVIEVDEVVHRNDSVFITTPVFEGYLAAAFDGDNLNGSYIKESLDRVVPFSAEYGIGERYPEAGEAKSDVTGNWEVIFSKGIEGDEYIAKGIFKQEDNKVTGTFRTTTGDYRYLEGVMDGNKMRISAFDGAHAFLFTAEVKDSTMSGTFYSGNHFQEPFEAVRNENYELPDANSLTFLKEGYDKFSFEFPDENGNMISSKDERFQNKVVLVQIMGTWCPNCLDESKFYSEFYNDLKSEDLEIVGLAFEYAKTEEAAFKAISRLKDRLDINYPILLAQVGSSSKSMANEKLPMLNHVLSYPTTVYLDKQGNVRKIHTGFNGPATGEKYEEFKMEFNSFVKSLLNE